MQREAENFLSILEGSSLFDIRESELKHTTYETEKRFFGIIKNGDVAKAREAVEIFRDKKIVAGKLSDDSLRQIKYWSVCCVTLATRAAIEGGLDETTAFSYSDSIIVKIDRMKSDREIFACILEEYVKFCSLVHESRIGGKYSSLTKRCLHYIDVHLHEELSVSQLAKLCNMSTDHFSKKFKAEVGVSPSQYIKKKKLLEAKEMLLAGRSISDTAYWLGFCSESYFIKCFQKEFSATPKQFINKR